MDAHAKMKPPEDIFMICRIATTVSSVEQVMAAAEKIVAIKRMFFGARWYVCVRHARASVFVIYTRE
jgi:hypothetical protein